jgi:hypothetical protein
VEDGPDRLKIPTLVIAAEIAGMDLVAEEKDSLGEKIFPESSDMDRKDAFANAKDHKPTCL